MLEISQTDLEELKNAKFLLENPGIAAKLTNILGSPIEKGFEKLPKNIKDKIGVITQKSLLKATEVAIFTIKNSAQESPSNKWHKLGVAASGGIGGFFGFSSLAIELPISTAIILRSIADIARCQGENLDEFESKLACIEVFALGGNNNSDDSTESGYFAIRSFLAKSITIENISKKTTSKEITPFILKFLKIVAQRFGIQITEKMAAQALPIIGAAGGAIINTIFIDHFQDMAKGHFIVRKLERQYSKETIKNIYKSLS